MIQQRSSGTWTISSFLTDHLMLGCRCKSLLCPIVSFGRPLALGCVPLLHAQVSTVTCACCDCPRIDPSTEIQSERLERRHSFSELRQSSCHGHSAFPLLISLDDPLDPDDMKLHQERNCGSLRLEAVGGPCDS